MKKIFLIICMIITHSGNADEISNWENYIQQLETNTKSVFANKRAMLKKEIVSRLAEADHFDFISGKKACMIDYWNWHDGAWTAPTTDHAEILQVTLKKLEKIAEEAKRFLAADPKMQEVLDIIEKCKKKINKTIK